MSQRAEFLSGDRPSDVHIFLNESAVATLDALEPHGTRVDDGLVLVMDGQQARSVFQSATGIDPMAFAKEAMGADGDVAEDCASASCPADGPDHHARFIFAFAEEQNEDVGGLYAEGPVIHAYVSCACGEKYSDKWVAADQH